MTGQNEFIASLEGELTPEDAAKLLEMELEGDTASADNSVQPGAEAGKTGGEPEDDKNAAATEQTENQPAAEPSDDELNAQNAVLLARDRKHTIDFERFERVRDTNKQLVEQLKQRDQELESLRVQQQAGAKPADQPAAQPTQADDDSEEGLFGDFSEEAFKAGVEKLVQQRLNEVLAEKLAPIEEKNQLEATQQHYNAIYTAHPDADSIAESKELADWIASKPATVQAAYQAVLAGGSAQEVIGMFSEYKAAAGIQTETAGDGKPDPKAAAADAIAKAKAPVPTSLSDFPGAPGAGATEFERMANLQGADLMEAMADWSPEKIEQFLNRRG